MEYTTGASPSTTIGNDCTGVDTCTAETDTGTQETTVAATDISTGVGTYQYRGRDINDSFFSVSDSSDDLEQNHTFLPVRFFNNLHEPGYRF
jgi:hypothetical protein